MKIFLAAAGSPPPTFIRRRAVALAKKDVEVMLSSRGRAGSEKLEGVAVFREAASTWPGLARLVAGLARRPCLGVRLMRAVHERLKSGLYFLARHPYLPTLPKPDLIHVQWIGSATSWKLVADVWKVPLLASVRGSQITVYMHKGKNYRTHLLQCLWACDGIHCVSQSLAERCQDLGPFQSNLFVNYNGINLQNYHPGNRGDSVGPLRVVTVGGLEPRKNLAHALLTVRSVKLPKGLLLEIVGDGPDKIYLQHAAQKLGIANRVKFKGALSENEVALCLSEANVYLSTSMAEGLANSVVEAAASGLPIVAYECEGMAEVVEHGVNGFLVPFGEVDDLTERLTILGQNKEMQRRMGEASRRIAEARFGEDKCVEEMIGYYRALINRKTGHG